MKKFFLIFLLLLLANNAIAATLQGSCYEWFSLEKINNVIIDVNSTPAQRIVAKTGDYSVQLQKGDYFLSAEFFENNELKYVSEEKITINNDGNYNLDLIMFPPTENDLNEFLGSDFDVNIELSNKTTEQNQKTESFSTLTKILLAIIVLVVLLAIAFKLEIGKRTKKITEKTNALVEIKPSLPEILPTETNKQTESEKLDKFAIEVLDTLHRNGNRLTQKELREKITSIGEAKISLIVSELEAAGKVKKIKKGRGNIIVLKEGA